MNPISQTKTDGNAAASSIRKLTIGRLSSYDILSLYFHIPFCKHKCPYCHFYVLLENEQLKDQLLEGLILEFKTKLPSLQNRTLCSLYFGGGTPTLFGIERYRKLFKAIREHVDIPIDCEITIEANPENSTIELMQQLKEIGFNRVSIGAQSFSTSELTTIDRRHNPDRIIDAVHAVNKAGISNITIDLMYDLPGQTLDSWIETLKITKTLPITHLSLYNLTIEPHTAFWKKKSDLQKKMPDDEASVAMYLTAIQELSSVGLEQYEISAFCKDQLFSHHNVGYWTGREFLGLGPSAFSFYDNVRFQNHSNLKRWFELVRNNASSIDYSDSPTLENRKKELLALWLRLRSGVDLTHFEARYGPIDQETYTALQSLQSDGLIRQESTEIQLTDRGVLFYDTVASELI